MKTILERIFSLINHVAVRFLPGALTGISSGNPPPCKQDTILTLQDLEGLVVRAILQHHQSCYLVNRIEASAIEVGITSPAKAMQWVCKNGKYCMCPPLIEDARLFLLPCSQAKVTQQGILFQHLYFTCARAETERWFRRAREFGTSSVRVRFDPRRADHLYILDERTGSVEVCQLIPACVCFKHSPWAAVYKYFKKRRQDYIDANREDLETGKNINNITQ
jgi:hypothetical protein